ncbi:MAG: hypothetical protein EBT03_08430 [Betaproteobacteria bacterium]|nr:hypothetical protein [Betaproteobacteria bacterium]
MQHVLFRLEQQHNSVEQMPTNLLQEDLERKEKTMFRWGIETLERLSDTSQDMFETFSAVHSTKSFLTTLSQ